MENKNTPEIRFKGFTDAWVQRTLGEIAEIKTGPFGSTLHAEDYVSDGTPIITTEHFKFGELPSIKNGVPQVSDTDYKRLKQYLLVKDDIVFSRVGSVDINALVSEMQEGWLFSGRVLRVRPNKNIIGLFLHYELDTNRTKNDVISRAVGQTMPSINTEILKDTSVYISESLSEQTAIGNFFRTLDDTITLYQRKLDGLKKLKAAYLQQMFPRAGECVPRVRFAGFTEPWEEKKLGIISTKVTEKNKNNKFNETFTNSAEYGIISQRDFFDKDISNKKNLDSYSIVRPNDFAYNPRISNFAPVGPIKRNLLGRTGVMSPLYYIFRITNGDHTFIENYFESVYWHDFMILNGDNGVRSDRFNIRDSVFEEMPIPFPNPAEQIVIGKYFQSLDKQIANQTTKLENLRRLKIAYLQKMFI